jgi:2,3-bisphosphoglycerate-independent phosphoglycerate mutase
MAEAGSSVGAKGPVMLIIRDGWGRSPHTEHDAFDAVKLARTPCADMLERDWPTTLIRTSGEDVGLPVGPDGPVMGNSEVGHQNLGAGRIVDQELMRITRAPQGVRAREGLWPLRAHHGPGERRAGAQRPAAP